LAKALAVAYLPLFVVLMRSWLHLLYMNWTS
jgi:hypothetical protein